MLDGVVSILEWEAEPDALDHAEAIYTNLIAESMGQYLGELERTNAPAARSIIRLLAAADAGTVQRAVMAPETTCRLLFGHGGACDRREFWEFLGHALEVELARANGEAHFQTSPARCLDADSCWSALGDFCIDGSGLPIRVQPAIAGLVVDMDSPSAVCFNPGLSYIGMQLKHYENAEEKQAALHKTEAAMHALDAVSEIISSFTRRFTRVANLLMDEKSGFSSGSTNEYVGRSIFWNAHRESVDVGTLAEAIVHEATHALLSMHEVTKSWFLSEEWLASEGRVESPWTGAQLRVEPFLQACFVWFGLANFWATARRGAYFNHERSEKGLAQARKGFLQGPLTDRVATHRPCIEPELLKIIQDMQGRILIGVTAGVPV